MNAGGEHQLEASALSTRMGSEIEELQEDKSLQRTKICLVGKRVGNTGSGGTVKFMQILNAA